MMYRIGALNTSREKTPYGIYEKPRRPLTDCILDSKTIELGKYLIARYICSSKIGGTSEDDCPCIDKISGTMIKIFQKEKKVLHICSSFSITVPEWTGLS